MTTSLIVTAFGILDFLGAPICALYIDRTSNRRIPFLGGVFIMAGGTILFGIGKAPWLLFLGRVLQGFASAILYTTSLALLVDTVPRDEVGKWLGVALSANNIGLLMSPLFGGIIYHGAGKYAVFGTMMALIGVDAILRLLMIAEPRRVRLEHAEKSRHSSLDSMAHTPLQQFPNHPNRPKLTLQIPTTRVTGILRLIRSPRLLAALYGIFLNECLNATLLATIPLFVIKGFHWNTLGAGLIFLTIAIPSLGGFLAGQLSDRFGPKPVAAAGLLIVGPTIILLRLVEYNSTKQIVLLCALLTVVGVATNLFLASLSADLSFVADEESRKHKAAAGVFDDDVTELGLYAASFSLMNSAMAAATLFGPLFMGWLNQNHGWGAMTAVLGGVVLSGVVPVGWFTGRRNI